MDNATLDLVETEARVAHLAFGVPNPDAISKPPTSFQKSLNSFFYYLCHMAAWLSVGLVAFIILNIFWTSLPALRHEGLGFITGSVWDPNAEQFGILPMIWGTLYSSILALLIGTFFWCRSRPLFE